jgi:hypothetical protein
MPMAKSLVHSGRCPVGAAPRGGAEPPPRREGAPELPVAAPTRGELVLGPRALPHHWGLGKGSCLRSWRSQPRAASTSGGVARNRANQPSCRVQSMSDVPEGSGNTDARSGEIFSHGGGQPEPQAPAG